MILFFALTILAVTVGYRLMNPFIQPEVKQLTYTGKNQVKPHNQKSGGGPMETDKLTSEEAAVSWFLNKPVLTANVHQDLFAAYHPPLPEVLPDTEDLNAETDTLEDMNAIEEIKEDPIQKAKEYVASYKLYGSYKSKNTKAIFLARDKLVLVAKKGDRLNGKFQIDDIQDNHIRIKALDLNETIHLDMREFNNE